MRAQRIPEEGTKQAVPVREEGNFENVLNDFTQQLSDQLQRLHSGEASTWAGWDTTFSNAVRQWLTTGDMDTGIILQKEYAEDIASVLAALMGSEAPGGGSFAEYFGIGLGEYRDDFGRSYYFFSTPGTVPSRGAAVLEGREPAIVAEVSVESSELADPLVASGASSLDNLARRAASFTLEGVVPVLALTIYAPEDAPTTQITTRAQLAERLANDWIQYMPAYISYERINDPVDYLVAMNSFMRDETDRYSDLGGQIGVPVTLGTIGEMLREGINGKTFQWANNFRDNLTQVTRQFDEFLTRAGDQLDQVAMSPQTRQQVEQGLRKEQEKLPRRDRLSAEGLSAEVDKRIESMIRDKRVLLLERFQYGTADLRGILRELGLEENRIARVFGTDLAQAEARMNAFRGTQDFTNYRPRATAVTAEGGVRGVRYVSEMSAKIDELVAQFTRVQRFTMIRPLEAMERIYSYHAGRIAARPGVTAGQAIAEVIPTDAEFKKAASEMLAREAGNAAAQAETREAASWLSRNKKIIKWVVVGTLILTVGQCLCGRLSPMPSTDDYMPGLTHTRPGPPTRPGTTSQERGTTSGPTTFLDDLRARISGAPEAGTAQGTAQQPLSAPEAGTAATPAAPVERAHDPVATDGTSSAQDIQARFPAIIDFYVGQGYSVGRDPPWRIFSSNQQIADLIGPIVWNDWLRDNPNAPDKYVFSNVNGALSAWAKQQFDSTQTLPTADQVRNKLRELANNQRSPLPNRPPVVQ
ncbi:hypothetical protein H0O01_00725 [Candidatus Micrarchaeota archaeon]|nr:hypothetical protein [Candidatus Micrarchaeota archaeon]